MKPRMRSRNKCELEKSMHPQGLSRKSFPKHLVVERATRRWWWWRNLSMQGCRGPAKQGEGRACEEREETAAGLAVHWVGPGLSEATGHQTTSLILN